jgi:taurine dioxygenase
MLNTIIDVRPQSATTGAEILGVDLRAPLAEQTFLEIREVLYEYGVIFFRDQDLTPAQHVDVAEQFGTIHTSPYMTPIAENPYVYDIRKEANVTRNVGGNWHTDHPFQVEPPLGALLLARELPPHGGDTLFASMYTAYETLSDGMKKTLEGLRAVHAKIQAFHGDKKPERQVGREKMAKLEVELKDAAAVHPAVLRHPGSGRKALYVNPSYTRISIRPGPRIHAAFSGPTAHWPSGTTAPSCITP